MTNTTNKTNSNTNMAQQFNFKKYIPTLLDIRKNTIKLPIGKVEELEAFVENILDIELEDLQPVPSDSRNYSGLFYAEARGKIYKLYAHITKQEFLAAQK